MNSYVWNFCTEPRWKFKIGSTRGEHGNSVGKVKPAMQPWMSMIRMLSMLSLFALVVVASCSTKESATAIVRFTHDDPSKPVTNIDMNNFIHEVMARDSIDQINQQLGLSKLWGLPDDQTDEKIHGSLVIEPGHEPGLFVIKCNVPEHQTGVQIINEIFAIHTRQQLDIPPLASKLNMSIVQAAK